MLSLLLYVILYRFGHTPAFYVTELITIVKSFMLKASGLPVLRLIYMSDFRVSLCIKLVHFRELRDTETQTDRQIDRQTEKPTERQTDR